MAPFSTKTILWVLTLMNVLNFIDRGIIPGATNEFIQFIDGSHIHANEDLYLGLLQSAFIVGYAVSSGIFGHLVHYYPPFRICLIGMTIWVSAVMFSGLSYYTKEYVCLFLARMLSGVAEASFQCSIPPWIAKHAAPEERGIWLSIFYTAIPVGTALGYAFSAVMAESVGWQYSFFIEGVLMLLFFPFLSAISPSYPCEGHSTGGAHGGHGHVNIPKTPEEKRRQESPLSARAEAEEIPSMWDELMALAKSPVYILLVAGYAMQTGAIIGVSTFGSAFLLGLGYYDTETQSSTTFGALVSVAGIIATPMGGIILDRMAASRMRRRDSTSTAIGNGSGKTESRAVAKLHDEERALEDGDQDLMESLIVTNDEGTERATLQAALVLITICSIGGAVLLCLDYFVHDKILFVLVIGAGCSFIFLTYSGISIAMMLCVPAKHRAFAMGISTLCIHVFGDVPSPIIAGYIKDRLAPGCAGGGASDGDSIATSDACRHDNQGLRLTMLLVTSLLGLTVLFFWMAWMFELSQKKRAQEQDSQTIHLLQDDVFDAVDTDDDDERPKFRAQAPSPVRAKAGSLRASPSIQESRSMPTGSSSSSSVSYGGDTSPSKTVFSVASSGSSTAQFSTGGSASSSSAAATTAYNPITVNDTDPDEYA